MGIISTHCRGYKNSLNGQRQFDYSWYDVTRAIITVGFHKSDFLNYYEYDLYRHIGLGFLANAYLSSNTYLSVTSRYHQLNRSEKGVFSQWYGMIFTKLISESLFGIRWLIYVDGLVKQGEILLDKLSNECPDFVGQDDTLQWHVFESKGRSYSVDNSLIRKAKKQASQIISIKNKKPTSSSASIICLKSPCITIDLIDPEPIEKDGLVVQFEGTIQEIYYANMIYYIKKHGYETKDINGIEFVISKLKVCDKLFYFGLPKMIFDKPRNALKILQEINDDLVNEEIDSRSIGLDGVIVFGEKKDWDEIYDKVKN